MATKFWSYDFLRVTRRHVGWGEYFEVRFQAQSSILKDNFNSTKVCGKRCNMFLQHIFLDHYKINGFNLVGLNAGIPNQKEDSLN